MEVGNKEKKIRKARNMEKRIEGTEKGIRKRKLKRGKRGNGKEKDEKKLAKRKYEDSNSKTGLGKKRYCTKIDKTVSEY